MVSEIANRFGTAVSERVAATALPIIGALGGATVNIMFMSHFEQIAEGHFTVRHVERRYGNDAIRKLYRLILLKPSNRAIAYRLRSPGAVPACARPVPAWRPSASQHQSPPDRPSPAARCS
jgi:EcsC protein family